jgi:hypothetical protein
VVTTHIEPPLALMADALTSQFLHPVMEGLGYSEEEIAGTVVWYDVSHMIVRPNRSTDAMALYDKGVISDESLRDATGFDEADAPQTASLGVPELTALTMVQAHPELLTTPGLAYIVEQLRALVKGEPIPADESLPPATPTTPTTPDQAPAPTPNPAPAEPSPVPTTDQAPADTGPAPESSSESVLYSPERLERAGERTAPGGRGKNPPLPSACPVCGAYSLLPDSDVSVLVAVTDVLTLKALEKLGSFIVRAERSRFQQLGQRPKHVAHTIWRADDATVDKALRGAWDVVPAILDVHGCCDVTSLQVTEMLDEYVHDLAVTGTAHSLDELEYRFVSRLGFPVFDRRPTTLQGA